MGQAADPVDGRADLRLAGQVPPPEQGPREERPVVGIVHQAGHDPVDVSPASPLRCGRRIPLSRCSLNRPYGTVTKKTGRLSKKLIPGTFDPPCVESTPDRSHHEPSVLRTYQPSGQDPVR